MKKIDEEIKRNLYNHQQTSTILHSHFSVILDYCFTSFLEESSPQLLSLQKSMPDSESLEDLNYSINILSIFIVECFRKNLQQMQLEFIMKDLEFKKEEIQIFQEMYTKIGSEIQERENELLAGQISGPFQRLIDVQIEQRYKIASKFLNNICQDNYLVKLKVLNNKNQVQNIMFSCHIEQLTELVHSLEAALKQVSDASKNVSNVLVNLL